MFNFLTFADQQSDTGRRILYVVLILVIIALALLSLIGWALVTFTRFRGKQLDEEIAPAVYSGVISDAKEFKRYYPKKNCLIFYRESLAPFLIALGGTLIFIIYVAITENWSYNPWSIDEGFGSLFFTWDFSKIFQVNVDGTTGLLINWPETTHTPVFLIQNWCGYVSCTAWIIAGVWYLYATVGLIGRHFRGRELSHQMYSLNDFNLFKQVFGAPNQNQANQPPTNQEVK